MAKLFLTLLVTLLLAEAEPGTLTLKRTSLKEENTTALPQEITGNGTVQVRQQVKVKATRQLRNSAEEANTALKNDNVRHKNQISQKNWDEMERVWHHSAARRELPSQNNDYEELKGLRCQSSSNEKVVADHDVNEKKRLSLVRRASELQPEHENTERQDFVHLRQDQEFHSSPGNYFLHSPHHDDIRHHNRYQQQVVVHPHSPYQSPTYEYPNYYGTSYYHNIHQNEHPQYLGDHQNYGIPHTHNNHPYHIGPYYIVRPQRPILGYYANPYHHYNHHHHHGGFSHQGSCDLHNDHHHDPYPVNESHDHQSSEDQDGRLFYEDDNSEKESDQDPHHIDPRHLK